MQYTWYSSFKFLGLKLMQVSRELASRHYAEHREKPFYEGLVAFITSNPVIAGSLECSAAQRCQRRAFPALTYRAARQQPPILV
jgi:nucleoside diphosphate kinase